MADLIVEQLCRQFVTQAETLTVLSDVQLEMSGGENLSIVGPSGCGKSTLLYILGTLDRPTSGTVSMAGVNPFSLTPQKQAAFRNEQIGFVFQDHHLLPQLSVLENVLLPALAQSKVTFDHRARAKELIVAVGLEDRELHLPSELSGGERQRVAVARALLNRPKLILADEPTGNLDEENTRRIAELLFELPRREGAMLITVTHSDWLAGQAARQMRIADHRLVAV